MTPPVETTTPNLRPETIHTAIRSLISNLIRIKDDDSKFTSRLDDGQVVDSKSWAGWDWTHGVGLYGIWTYYKLTSDASLLGIIEAWFVAHLVGEGASKNVNTMAVFLTLAHLYESDTTRHKSCRPWLLAWAGWAMHELPRTPRGGMQHVTLHDRNPGQLWDDTLMMTVLPLAKIGVLFGRDDYVAEARRQFEVHCQYLCDANTGLFFHGWSFEDGGQHFARARWARGNSWLTMVIPEFLELLDLPATDPFRVDLLGILEAQCLALKALQDESGLWHTLLDHDDEGSYLEASATAGFAFGMLKARRMGYIGEEYAESAENAVRGVMANIGVDGELQKTSFGTAMGNDLDFYRSVPKTAMPYGQAMAIMALAEYLRRKA